MDWDDYKYFSAVAATRSVRAAAEQLDVNPSTVSRRLEHFEQRLGVQLFTRSPRGLTITPEGAEVIARVNEIAADLGNIEGKLIGQDQRLSGLVRVVIPEVIALSLLVKELSRFQTAYPDIEISMVPGHQRPNINIREADVLAEQQIIRLKTWSVAHYRQSLLPHTGLKSSLTGIPEREFYPGVRIIFGSTTLPTVR